MKKLILILLCLFYVPLVFADDLKIKGSIRPDPLWNDGRYQILNKDGNQKGWIKKDPLWSTGSNRYLILDKKGNEQGIIKPDYLWNDRLIIEKKK